MAAAANYYERRWGKPIPDMTPAFAETIITRWRADVNKGIVAIPSQDTNPAHSHPVRIIKGHQSGMPDADYLKSFARAEYAWFHRMEAYPLGGFDKP